MSPAKPPSPWRGAQLDFQAIEAETDRIRLLGLDVLAQDLSYLGRRYVAKEA